MPEAVPSNADLSIFSVDTLLKYMGNDDKALAIVAKVVRDACAPQLQPIQLAAQALREQRFSDAGKIFHSLRGSIGTLGAKRLVAASLALEQAIADRQQDQIPALFAVVESEYKLVLQLAADWLQQHAPIDGQASAS